MRVRYSFDIAGNVRIASAFPIGLGEFDFEFFLDGHNRLEKILVTLDVPDELDWPKAMQSVTPGAALTIQNTSPRLEEVKNLLRTAESMLSFFGLDSIDFATVQTEWLPANLDERQRLGVLSFRCQTKRVPIDKVPETPFDLVARSIMSANRLDDRAPALIFFRKGRLDIKEHRYIEACVDFLFMVETLFANGKIKSRDVIGSYKKSTELQTKIDTARRDSVFISNVQYARKTSSKIFLKLYMTASSEEITEHLVGLRGLLHHHSLKNKSAWHPEGHGDFTVDAFFLQNLCYSIGFDVFNSQMFAQDMEKEYLELLHANQNPVDT